MGYGGGYILAGAESRGKAAVAARVVMLGGGVVRVKSGGSEDGLVAIAVEGVVRVGGAGHVAGGGGGIGGCIEGIPARIVHGLAIFTDAESEVAWVVVAVAAVVAVANVVAVVVRCLAVSFLGFLGLFCGACACGFLIGFVSPLFMLETLTSSRARRIFILASVSLDRLGGATMIDGGPHSPDGKL